MKKSKILAIVLSLTLVVSGLCACSSSSDDTQETETSTAYAEGDTVYGEVTAVGEKSITIAVGELSELAESMLAADALEAADSQSEDAEAAEGQTQDIAEAEIEDMAEMDMDSMEEISMLDLTGEELEISVSDSTTYTKVSMGGMGNGMQSQGGMGGGAAMEMPSGDMGDMTDIELPEGENMAEMDVDMELPEGDMGDGDMELPEGETFDMEAFDAIEGEMVQPSGGGMQGGASGGMQGGALGGNTPSGMGDEAMELPEGETMAEMDADVEMPSGDMEDMAEMELSDIAVGDIVAVVFDSNGGAAQITVYSMGMTSMGGDMGEAMSGGMSASSGAPSSYTAVSEYTEDADVDGESFTSTGSDENAIHVFETAIVTFSNITVSRVSSNSTGGDDSSFYGVGAAVLVTDGTAYISDADIDTDSAGGAGVFSYGDGIVYVADSTIVTAQDTSGGIHVAGGGTLYAWDLDVDTSGNSSAAVRSDRGSGVMVVDGGSYVSNGTGSPAVYSTADITINGAVLTANASEAVCIEGLNSLRLFDCDLSGNMADDSQNDSTWTVILYQSMSGDSEEGNSTFEMIGGTLTSANGGLFYTTNTESTFILSGVDITAAANSEYFLMCTGNANERGWGSTGSNGANCTFTAINQVMEGKVIWDSISTLDFYMTNGSSLKGAILNDETYAGNGGSGYCNVYIESGSTWTVTGNSQVTNLYCAGTIVDGDGNTVTIKGSDGTVYVEGSSHYTVTVESYQTSADLSGASTTDSWADYAVEKPEQLA